MTERDDLLDYAAVASLTGLAASTLRQYRTKGLLPEPDETPAPDRPRWREATIRRWLAERPGRGAPGRPRNRRKPAAAVAAVETTEENPMTENPTTEPAPFVCEWEGHDDATEEHGWCPVCQGPDESIDPSAIEADDRPLRTVAMRAEFARVKDATEFVATYLAGGKSSSSEVERKGRVVTWTATTRNEQYVWDLAENAGYVGSYGGRYAYVNGIRAPRSY